MRLLRFLVEMFSQPQPLSPRTAKKWRELRWYEMTGDPRAKSRRYRRWN